VTDSDQLSREAAEKLFAAWERWDLEAVGSLVADNAVDERPQSGERFIGRNNIMGMYAEVPGPPRIRWQSVVGGPSVWVAEGIVEYGEGPVNIVLIAELMEAKLQRTRIYFADPFEPPAQRARWSDAPIDEGGSDS
jgi:SnoaL-like domain